MNGIYETMLNQHNLDNEYARQNAHYEVMQQVILGGLYRGGFFEKAAFYGGTCLRIFHGLKRYSEDMDFSLLKKESDFSLDNYFQSIIEEAKLLGREVIITKKNKKSFSKVESAFLKDNTDVYDISFQTDKSLKIKIEVDTNPPMEFDTEHKLLMLPFSFMTRCFTLPDLYAGKMHALVFRQWKNRVKGRDWYDFEWFVRNRVPLDFNHLRTRSKEINGLDLTKDDFIKMLKMKLTSTDINAVKNDVLPFIVNPKEIEIWSNEYFLQIADMMIIE